jgi:hypothetical protein
MKKAEYLLERKKISEIVKQKGLIKKLQDIVLFGKMVYKKERDYSTHVKWEYENGSFLIEYESGYFAMGDGEEISVKVENNQIFLAYDESFKKHRYSSLPSIKLENNMNLGIFLNGHWLSEIDSLLENISDEEEKRFKENFKVPKVL